MATTVNHHSLLSSALHKIAQRQKMNSRQKDQYVEPEQNLFNKLAVRNALTRDTSLTVGERFNLYRSYEEAIKNNKEEMLTYQEEILSKLSIAKPPSGPRRAPNLNNSKHFVVIKTPLQNSTSLQRKTAFVEKEGDCTLTKMNSLNTSIVSSSLPKLSALKTFVEGSNNIQKTPTMLSKHKVNC